MIDFFKRNLDVQKPISCGAILDSDQNCFKNNKKKIIFVRVFFKKFVKSKKCIRLKIDFILSFS